MEILRRVHSLGLIDLSGPTSTLQTRIVRHLLGPIGPGDSIEATGSSRIDEKLSEGVSEWRDGARHADNFFPLTSKSRPMGTVTVSISGCLRSASWYSATPGSPTVTLSATNSPPDLSKGTASSRQST